MAASLSRVSAAVSLALQEFQSLQDVLLDISGGVVIREESAKGLPLQADLLLLVRLGLSQGTIDHPTVQDSDVISLVQPHRLGVGRGAIVSRHGVQQVGLGLVGKIGQLYAYRESNPALVHEFQQFRQQIGQPDIAKHLIPALVGGRADLRRLIRLKLGQVSLGTDQMFPCITALVLGGTSLTGGKGGMLQTMVGTLIYMELLNFLTIIQVPADYKKAILGIIIIIAVALTLGRDRKTIVK